MSRSLTVDEAKEITHRLENLVLVLIGTKDENGKKKIEGVMDQLETILNKLNPERTEYLGNLARKRAHETLIQIEEMFEKQQSYFETQNLMFDRGQQEREKTFEDAYKKMSKQQQLNLQNITKHFSSETNYMVDRFKNDVKNEIENLQDYLHEMKEILTNRYLWISLGCTTSVCVGILIGLWIK